MEYSWLETGPESSDDDKEKKDEKRRALGALTSRSSVEKEREEKEKEKKASEKPKKEGFEGFFRDKSEKKEEKKPFKLFGTKLEDTPKNKGDAQAENTTEDAAPEKLKDKALKTAATEALREQLPINIAKLEAERALAAPNTPEYEAAEAALVVEKRLQEKVEDPSIDVEPEIDAEFDRRIAELVDAQKSEIAEDSEPEASDETTDPDLFEAEAPVTLPPLPPVTPSASRVTPATRSRTTPPRGPELADEAPTEPTTTPVTVPDLDGPGSAAPEARDTAGFGSTSGSGASGTTETRPTPPAYAPEKRDTNERQPRRASTFAAGGIIGYAIGRHGGRKRTEARLKPVVEKLEGEVEKTKRRLQVREDELKAVVREQREQPRVTVERTQVAIQPEERLVSPVHPKPVAEVLRHTVAPSEVQAEAQPELAKATQPEALSLPLQKAETEVVNIFDMDGDKSEKADSGSGNTQITQHEIRQIEQLSTPELLHRAEMLYISGVNVKELYNTNQIDRGGLVKIIQESMRGRDIKAVFEKVELGRERQRERAREFRHDDTALAAASSSQSAKPVIPPIAQPLGHTVIQDVKTHNVATQHPPLNLPNTPDSSDLQPLQQSSPQASPTRAEKVAESAVKIPAEFKLAAVAAVAIAVLIAWVILS
ncbi:MAG: hypothetical protein U0520_01440 [Candidatus Saccharimonadales bacterium]